MKKASKEKKKAGSAAMTQVRDYFAALPPDARSALKKLNKAGKT